MSVDWPLVSIDDIKAGEKGSIAIGPFGSRMKSDCYVDEGIPVIRGTNITGGPTFEGDFVYITEEKADTLGSSNVYQYDLVFPHRGSIGEVGIILEDERYVLSSSLMKLTCDRNKVNPKFLYYFFKSRLGRHELLKNASQVGTPGIGQPLTSLKGIEFRLPPLEVQDEIEEMLTSLDDKIELNRQTNQTLEHIAQAIFKSWFVDFEPTRAKSDAKQNGQDPERAAMVAIAGFSINNASDACLDKLDTLSDKKLEKLKSTAALFPDKLVESELGEMPEGWGVMALDEIAHYQNGLALQKFRPEDENNFLPVLKIAQLKKGFADGAEKASPNIKEECIVNDGDVVFSWSGSLMIDVWCGGKAALNQHLFKVTSELYPKWFYYYWTKRHLESFRKIASDKAVTMGHIKRSHLAEAKCAVPDTGLIAIQQIGFLLDKIIEQRLECKSLEQVRDTLLPKLLSGELEVASAN